MGLVHPDGPWLRCTRLRAGIGLCTIYPWFALVWWLGWIIAPYRPPHWFRHAADLLMMALAWGYMAVLVVGPLLLFSEVLTVVEQRGSYREPHVVRSVYVPLGSWFGAGLVCLVILWRAR